MLAYPAHMCIRTISIKKVKSFYYSSWPTYATYALITQFSPSLDDENPRAKVQRLAVARGQTVEEVAYQVHVVHLDVL